MLMLTIKGREKFDEAKQEFIEAKDHTILLEHSLVSVSKWESKWHVPFLYDKNPKTNEQIMDYIRCMTITQNVDPSLYYDLDNDAVEKIQKYIDDPMTATTIRDERNSKKSSEIVTSELIYYWMIANNIPVEFEKWHLNRLLTLIKVCSIKNTPPKKMSKRATMTNNAALNAARRKAHNTRG